MSMTGRPGIVAGRPNALAGRHNSTLDQRVGG
jgi:hypothetical protein